MLKAICLECGNKLEQSDDGLFHCDCCFNTWTSEEVEWIDDDDITDYNDIPEGCKACGGPYPSCKISCKIFDD